MKLCAFLLGLTMISSLASEKAGKDQMQLTAPELSAARSFLRQARMLVSGVRSLFFNVGDASTAARLNDIDGRLGDEITAIEQMLAGGQP